MILNKNFFKFAFGFIALVLLGLLGLFATNYYDMVNSNDDTENTARVDVED